MAIVKLYNKIDGKIQTCNAMTSQVENMKSRGWSQSAPDKNEKSGEDHDAKAKVDANAKLKAEADAKLKAEANKNPMK